MVEQVRHQVAIGGTVSFDTGEPASGARVEITSGPAEFEQRIEVLTQIWGAGIEALSRPPNRALAALDGLFYFLDLPDGTYDLTATIPNAGARFGTGEGQATVGRDPSGRVILAKNNIVIPSTAVSGRVVDAQTCYAAQVRLTSSVVSRWRLGEPTGPFRDDVGTRDASPVGAVLRAVPSLLAVDDDAATGFTGSGYLEVVYTDTLNPPSFSVQAWARVDGGAGTERCVVTSRDSTSIGVCQGWQLSASSADEWEFRVGDGSKWAVAVGQPVTLGRAVYLVGTYDGSQARLFVDGSAPVTSGSAAFVPNAARPLRIGAGTTEGAASAQFIGVIDEVAVYRSPLEGSAVAALYQFGSSPTSGTGLPMVSLIIEGSGEAAVSRGDGTFRLIGLEPGARRLDAAAAGYQPQTRVVTVAAAAETPMVVLLAPRT
jgi:hypothetical protein